jgi:hypothetical protein
VFDDVAILWSGFDTEVAPARLQQPGITRAANLQALNAGIFMLANGFEHASVCCRIDAATHLDTLGSSQREVRVDLSYLGTVHFSGADRSLRDTRIGSSAELAPLGSGNNRSREIAIGQPPHAKQAERKCAGLLQPLGHQAQQQPDLGHPPSPRRLVRGQLPGAVAGLSKVDQVLLRLHRAGRHVAGGAQRCC